MCIALILVVSGTIWSALAYTVAVIIADTFLDVSFCPSFMDSVITAMSSFFFGTKGEWLTAFIVITVLATAVLNIIRNKETPKSLRLLILFSVLSLALTVIGIGIYIGRFHAFFILTDRQKTEILALCIQLLLFAVLQDTMIIINCIKLNKYKKTNLRI